METFAFLTSAFKPRNKKLPLTLSIHADLVTFHPGRALRPRLRPHSARVPSVMKDGVVGVCEVTLKAGGVHTARSVGL